MTKAEFLDELREGLLSLPPEERRKALDFYEEMIQERMDEGMPEHLAVRAVGSVEDAIAACLQEQSFQTVFKHRVQKSREQAGSKTLWMILAILGAPVWIGFVLGFGGLLFAFVMILLSLVFSLFVFVAAGILSAPLGLAAGIGLIFGGFFLAGLAKIGAGFFYAGLALLLLGPVMAIGRWIWQFIRATFAQVKRMVIGG